MLAKSVDSLAVVKVLENLTHRPALVGLRLAVGMNLGNLVWGEGLAATFLVAGNQLSLRIGKPDLARSGEDIAADLSCTYHDLVAFFLDRIVAVRRLVNDDKALSVSELIIGCC